MKFLQSMLVFLFLVVTSNASALDGLMVSELPLGGDVTVPSDYPVVVPEKVDVVFSGVMDPQAITLHNTNSTNQSVVKIYATHEKTSRTVTLKPGGSAVYSFKNTKPIRIRVISGDVKVSSIQPLKVQR